MQSGDLDLGDRCSLDLPACFPHCPIPSNYGKQDLSIMYSNNTRVHLLFYITMFPALIGKIRSTGNHPKGEFQPKTATAKRLSGDNF